MLTEILIVALLIVVNGALAMSELAVVSARTARLRAMAETGVRGAATAIRLAEHPGRFLSAVQIGITLVGVLSGAFSGATLGARLSGWLAARGLSPDMAYTLGVGGVVVVLTYLSLIVGELVPKQIALRNPEAVAALVAGPMSVISRVTAPIVWLLDRSGRLVLALVGLGGKGDQTISDLEIRSLLAEAHEAEVIEPEEKQMMEGVMRLGDRSARGIMTPRHEVETVPSDTPLKAILARFAESGHTRIPVENAEGEIVGVWFMRDFIEAAGGARPNPAALIRDVPVVSDRADALDVLKVLRDGRGGIALVYDEFGHFEGIVTAGDFLGAITGGLDDDEEEPAVVRREDGSWLVAGWMPADEFRDALGVPLPENGDFDTVAGLFISIHQRLPELGDVATLGPWRFEVVDMDGRRIDKVLVARAAE
ncbi:MAG: hemolysin family protein [Pseudomonadota bacterium]